MKRKQTMTNNSRFEFRAWSYSRKEMIYDWQDLVFIESFGFDGGESFDVMRNTDLTDKNGKNIYEYDIVKSPASDNQMVVKYKKIEVSDDMTASGIGFQFNTYPEEMEIIGNIYANPELIEGKT